MREITKVDEFTLKITGTTPYEQMVTKDQLLARVVELDNNISGFQKRIEEFEQEKIEVQLLIEEADKNGLMTRDERQAKQPKVEVVTDEIVK